MFGVSGKMCNFATDIIKYRQYKYEQFLRSV